jgi:hypothetical protein
MNEESYGLKNSKKEPWSAIAKPTGHQPGYKGNPEASAKKEESCGNAGAVERVETRTRSHSFPPPRFLSSKTKPLRP